jgi:hypothetical protein
MNLSTIGGGVKSVQRGSISTNTGVSTSVSVTISSVNTSKAVLFINGYMALSGTPYPVKGALTNSTTITISFNTSVTINADWQVVEYY